MNHSVVGQAAQASRTLLASLASAPGTDHLAKIVYMEDVSALPNYVLRCIRRLLPQIALSWWPDRDAIKEFITLPRCQPNPAQS